MLFFHRIKSQKYKKIKFKQKKDVYYDVSSEIFVHPQGFEPWTH